MCSFKKYLLFTSNNDDQCIGIGLDGMTKNGTEKRATFTPLPKKKKNYTFFFLLPLSKYQMILHVGESCWNIPRKQRATEKKIPTWYKWWKVLDVEFNQHSVLLTYPTRLAKAKTPRKKKYTASRRLMYSLEKICK